MKICLVPALLAGLLLSTLAGTASATQYLYAASPYNVFVRNNFNDFNSDTWGGVAAGGTVSTSGGMGFASHNPALAYAVVAAVNFSAAGSGSVGGNLYDGTAGGINGSFTVNGSITSGGGNPANSPIDFADAFASLGALSTSLAARSTTAGDGCVNYFNQVICTASASGLNVINVSAGNSQSTNGAAVNSYDMGANYGFTLNVSNPNATVVINVAGASGTFTSGSGFTVNGVGGSRVLFNFYQATSLTLGTSGVDASLLAPIADVTKFAYGGNFNGTFIARSFTANASEEFHTSALFDGALPTSATPEPAGMLLFASGLVTLIWRRFSR